MFYRTVTVPLDDKLWFFLRKKVIFENQKGTSYNKSDNSYGFPLKGYG